MRWRRIHGREVSTPLLNLRAQMLDCRREKTPAFQAVSLLFALVFLTVRWGVGVPASVGWWGECVALMRAGDPRLRLPVLYFAMASNLMLNGFNLFWGAKVIRGFLRVLMGERRSASRKK